MERGGDIERYLEQLADTMMGPGMLYALERHFWQELWRVPVLEAVEEWGIEVRHYGPIRAFAYAGEPRTPLFNLMLGAEAPGAVEAGHLTAALDWTESLGVDCRIPIRPDFGEPGAAEDQLNRRGYRQAATQALFVRDAAPPDFPEPAGIEVEELSEECEGFSELFAPIHEHLWPGHTFLIGLPGRRDWRCYAAMEEEGPWVGAATTMLHHQVAQLGFVGVWEEARGRGVHMALLRRRIVDARAAGAGQIFAITEEPLDYPDSRSAAARNLVRAGFGAAAGRTVWRPPEDLLADEGEDESEDDRRDDEDGPEDDHDFELER